MKRNICILLLSIIFNFSYGQTHFADKHADYADILLKCITADLLQLDIPIDAGKSAEPIIIKYWHPLVHPIDIDFNSQGIKILFVLMNIQSESDEKAYFLFKKLEFMNEIALVNFDYVYYDSGSKLTMSVMQQLEKTTGKWLITKTNILNNN